MLAGNIITSSTLNTKGRCRDYRGVRSKGTLVNCLKNTHWANGRKKNQNLPTESFRSTFHLRVISAKELTASYSKRSVWDQWVFFFWLIWIWILIPARQKTAPENKTPDQYLFWIKTNILKDVTTRSYLMTYERGQTPWLKGIYYMMQSSIIQK